MIIALSVLGYAIIGILIHFWSIWLQVKYNSIGINLIRENQVKELFYFEIIFWPITLFVIGAELSYVYYCKLKSKL